jgi:hypothetical protein
VLLSFSCEVAELSANTAGIAATNEIVDSARKARNLREENIWLSRCVTKRCVTKKARLA